MRGDDSGRPSGAAAAAGDRGRLEDTLDAIAIRTGGARESVADPALVRLTGPTMLGRENTAGERVVGSLLGLGVDVDAVDADRRRTEEAQTLRGSPIEDIYQPDLGVGSELAVDPFDERERRLMVGAAVEVEDLDQRPAALAHRPSIRQQAATCSALSSSSPCASASSFSTRL